MLTKTFEPPALVVIALSGVVTASDQADLVRSVRHNVRTAGAVRLLVQLELFGGWNAAGSLDDTELWLQDNKDVSKIAIVGTLSDYKPQPFMFMMTRGELAPESLPVAGGPCADPRPQMCTRDYRPACGLHRDGTRKTYGNACSACSNPDVLTQSAGACP